VIVNGDEFENIELKHSNDVITSTDVEAVVIPDHASSIPRSYPTKRDVDNNISDEPMRNQPKFGPDACMTHPVITRADGTGVDMEQHKESSSGYVSESGDMLLAMVRAKELETSKRKGPVKTGSLDSDISDTSNLVRRLL